jgi:hypothetical protein
MTDLAAAPAKGPARGRPPGTTKAVLRSRVKPPKQVKRFEGIPHTIQRLAALKPGQSLRLYRGTIDDMDRDGTPLHNQMLHDVLEYARRLEAQGKILLREYSADVRTATGCVRLIDFVATGMSKGRQQK